MTTASVARRQPERRPAIKCTKRKSPSRGGGPCGAYAVKGTVPPICAGHGGKAPQVRRKAHVRAELQAWGLNDQVSLVDPVETMLRLLTQSYARVELYSGLMREAFDAGERQDAGDGSAADDLERVLTTGGVRALIGYKRSAAADGTIYRSEEIVRGLAKLEAEERDRAMKFAERAVAAGLNERIVRVAEHTGAMLATVLRSALTRLELTAEQLNMAPMIIEQAVSELLGE